MTDVNKNNISCVAKKFRLLEEINYLRRINDTHKLKDEDEWETVWQRYRFNIAPHYRIRVKGENQCQHLVEVASKLFKSDVTVIEDKKENE